LRVLVACEFSGVVREAFNKKGHYALSCDLEPTSIPGNHYQGDVLDILDEGWDLMIAHPPCTYLTVSGNRWFYHPEDKDKPVENRRPHPRFPNRLEQRKESLEFVQQLLDAPIDKIALENPVGVISTNIRKPDQIIQPYEFGDPFEKKTCLWLKNLPKLEPTNIVEPEPRVVFDSGKSMPKWFVDSLYNHPPKERTKIRNTTFPGIADAIANQWG